MQVIRRMDRRRFLRNAAGLLVPTAGLLIPTPAWAAYPLINSILMPPTFNGTPGSGGVSNAMNGIGGNLAVGAMSKNTTITATVSDSLTNTWNVGPSSGSAALDNRIDYSFPFTPGAAQTFQIAGTAIYSALAAAVFSGAVAGTPQTSTVQGFGSSLTLPSITPNTPYNLSVVSLGDYFGNPTFSIDSGFTILRQIQFNSSVNFGLMLAYKYQTTAAAVAPTITDSPGPIQMAASMIVFPMAAPNTAKLPFHSFPP